MLVAADAACEPMRVHVRQPEHDRGDHNDCRNPTGLIGIRLGGRDYHGERHDRPVHEAAEPLTRRRTPDPGHHATSSQVPHPHNLDRVRHGRNFGGKRRDRLEVAIAHDGRDGL